MLRGKRSAQGMTRKPGQYVLHDKEGFIGRYVRPRSYFRKLERLERRANVEQTHEQETLTSDSDTNMEQEADESPVETSTGMHQQNETRGNEPFALEPVHLSAVVPPSEDGGSDQISLRNWSNLTPVAQSTLRRSYNLGTSVAVPPTNVGGKEPRSDQPTNINKWMKQENWPHEKFVDPPEQEKRRLNWVEWANGFKLACKLAGNMSQEQMRMMFLGQGRDPIWRILGTEGVEMPFIQMWEKVDQYYASTSDPSVHAAAYREMKQKPGEQFMCFITRLKQQSRMAEMSDADEEKEMRLALTERSAVSQQLRVHLKLSPWMTNTQLQALGNAIEPPCRVLTVGEQPVAGAATYSERRATRDVSVIQDGMQERKNLKRRYPQDIGANNRSMNGRSCRSCGKTHSGQCMAPRSEKACFQCGKLGHFAKDCTQDRLNRGKASGSAASDNQVHQVKQDNWD